MKKKLTDLSELAAAEAVNLKENVKYLGSSRILVNDVESVNIVPEETNGLGLSILVNFFDMPHDSVIPCFFVVLGTHRLILQLFGRILQPYMSDFSLWEQEYKYLDGKLDRHMQKWAPDIIKRDAARSGGPQIRK